MSNIKLVEYGENNDRGNLLGVELFVNSKDYVSSTSFNQKIDQYLAYAQKCHLLNEKTIIVFPEYLGTWLALTDLPKPAYRSNLNCLMLTLIIKNLPAFLKLFLQNFNAQKSIFSLQSPKMAAIYHDTFSSLAQKYHVTIVAGSIILSNPQICRGQLKTTPGPLYNISVLYNPDGTANETIVKKVFPVKAEQSFVTPAQLSDLPIFQTPAGRLAILICADSWYPQSYQKFDHENADFIAVPSYLAGDSAMSRIWPGYDGAANPDDVNPDDIGTITEFAAWQKYALVARAPRNHFKAGINVFLRGDVGNLGSDGNIVAFNDSQIYSSPADSDIIANIWL